MNSSRMGYTTYLSGMLVTVSAIVPVPEENDCHFAQSKGFRAVSENWTLTDALEQQEAGPADRPRGCESASKWNLLLISA